MLSQAFARLEQEYTEADKQKHYLTLQPFIAGDQSPEESHATAGEALGISAGAVQVARNSMGFTKQDHSSDDTEAINKLFTPEFRNRLDTIVRFNSLSKDVIAKVVDKELLEVVGQSQLLESAV